MFIPYKNYQMVQHFANYLTHLAKVVCACKR